MADTRRLTAAQRRALEWLPADGSWVIHPGPMHLALASLRLYHRDLMEADWGGLGPRGGRVRRYRLTPLGQQIRMTLQAAKKAEINFYVTLFRSEANG